MDNIKIYQIYHYLITYFATLISPIKSQLGPIFRTGGSIIINIGNIGKETLISDTQVTFTYFLRSVFLRLTLILRTKRSKR